MRCLFSAIWGLDAARLLGEDGIGALTRRPSFNSGVSADTAKAGAVRPGCGPSLSIGPWSRECHQSALSTFGVREPGEEWEVAGRSWQGAGFCS